MLVLLRRPRISFHAVAITAVSSSSIMQENPSAWFLVSVFCSLSATSSSKTSWMLFYPSTSALTASARSHHRVPGKPLSVSVQRFFSCCQWYVESDRNTYSPLTKWKTWYSHPLLSTAWSSTRFWLWLQHGIEAAYLRSRVTIAWTPLCLLDMFDALSYDWILQLPISKTFFLYKVQKYASHLLCRVFHDKHEYRESFRQLDSKFHAKNCFEVIKANENCSAELPGNSRLFSSGLFQEWS